MSNKRPPAWNSSPDDSQSTARVVQREEPGGIDAIGQQVERLKPLLRAMRRHWMFGLWGLLGVGLLVGLYVARFNPKYRSETVIYHQAPANPERITGQQAGRADPMLLRELLLRHGRLEALIDEMGMYRQMVDKVGKVAAVEELKKRISFQPLGRRTFRVGYVGDSPEEAQQVAARLAGSLIEDENLRRQDQAKKSAKFLEGEVEKATAALQEKEDALESFIAANPDFAAAALNRTPAAPAAPAKPAAKAKTKEKPAKTKTKKVRIRRRVPVAAGSALPAPLPRPKPKPKPVDPKLTAERDAALRQLGQATRKLAQLQSSYTDKHPEVISAKSRVADAEARVAKANNALMEAASDDVYDDDPAPAPAPIAVPVPAGSVEIEVEVPVAPKKKKKGKKAKEKEKKPEPEVVPDKNPTATAALETEWARLTRGVNDSRDREERLINELSRANLAARSQVEGHDARVVVLDEAFLPARPIRSARFFLKLGIPFAFLVAFALVLLRAIIDDRIFVSDDLVARGFDPILSVVPAVRGNDA